jgi:hypothetical protein
MLVPFPPSFPFPSNQTRGYIAALKAPPAASGAEVMRTQETYPATTFFVIFFDKQK